MTRSIELDGACAVVTGAAGGIGLAISRRLLASGADVVMGDIDGDRLAGPADELSAEFAGRVHPRAVDVTSSLGISALLEQAPRPVDLYVANAGVLQGFGLQAPPQQWATSWDVNVMAHVEAARQLVPQWLERASADRPGGCFLSVASAAGLLTQLGSASYSATKHAAVGFAEWLAASFGDRGVQVCCVCPMGVQTPMLEQEESDRDRLAERGPDAALAFRAVTSAGETLSAEAVADAALDAVAQGRFLAVPHAEVATMYARKAADPDAWISGMQRMRRSLET